MSGAVQGVGRRLGVQKDGFEGARSAWLLLRVSLVAGLLAASPASAQKGAKSPHGELKLSCTECHTLSAWKPLADPLPYQHAKSGFELSGAHARASCKSCHEALVFSTARPDCLSCHQAALKQARQPDHRGFAPTCQSCHGTRAWKPATFSHDQTHFQLRGAHRAVDCASCHAKGFQGTPTDCFSCHQSQFASATHPRHAGLPNACQDCHSENAWQPASFNHASTSFQLRGAHRSVECASCHARGYSGTPSDCFSCHQSQFTSAKNPSHAGFPNT
ncbi:MAG TPA: hypothetical protein PK413_07045, partial [Thermoanaerobaculia bacterium]|nr:hypothetical protein [Thermoanaerobaculia bacterium]